MHPSSLILADVSAPPPTDKMNYRSKLQQLTISPSLQNLDNSEGRSSAPIPTPFRQLAEKGNNFIRLDINFSFSSPDLREVGRGLKNLDNSVGRGAEVD